MHRSGVGLRTAAGTAVSGVGAPSGVGGSRSRRHNHIHGQSRRRRPNHPSRHRDSGHAACRVRKFKRIGGLTTNTGIRTSSPSWRTPNSPASLNTVYLRSHGCYSGWVPRAGWVKPESDQRLSDHISLGVLTRVFPPELVDAVLAECSRVERRHRLLPARVVVYYVLGLALFSTSSYEEGMRMLVSAHSWASGWSHEWSIPTKAALFQARRRLGSEPLRSLYDKAAVPLANPQVAGDFYRSWRLMGIDGLYLDLADTGANVERFGRPPSSRGGGRGGAFPQVRVLGLAECGSHAIIDAAIGTYSQGEQTLAESVLRSLKPGMLLLADRGFFSYTLWDKSRATGADLLWRLKSNAVLPVEKRYSDGSFASHIYPGTKP